MALGARQRILLTLLPVLLIVAAVVGAGLNLMGRLEKSVPAAVAEKSDRVLVIEIIGSDFNRLDASFQTALSGSLRTGREQHEQVWPELNQKLADAERDADSVDEHELVAQATRLADDYRRQGEAFYAPRESASARSKLYYGPHGLQATLQQLKKVLTECFLLKQASMTASINNAYILVENSLLSVEVMIAVTIVLAGLAAGYRVRTILRPHATAANHRTIVGVPLEPDYSGPICLCAVSVWLAVVSAWNTFTSRPVSSAAAALLTPRGAEIYRPEYDIPIYMAGLTVAVLAAVGWAWVWQRSWQAANTDRGRRNVSRMLKFHKWCAVGSVGLACVFPDGRLLNAYCAAMAALAAAFLCYEARRTGNDSAPAAVETRAADRAERSPRRASEPIAAGRSRGSLRQFFGCRRD